MTLNGHDRTYGFRMVSTNSEGKKVLQMLQNYQDYPGPGPAAPDGSIKNSGYLRKIIFDPDAGKVSVQTFSPTFTAQPVLTGDAHQFSYDVAFLPQLAGGSVSPIFVTDAATCPAIGHAQPFDASPGPGGTSLPLGWTAMQIAGDAGTFSSARPIGPADVAAAAAGNQTLLTVSAAPTGPWTGQLANIPGARSTGQAIGSNPGGNAASVIQLKVTNGTGEQTNFIHLYYELARPWASLDDDGTELPGFSLFWSVTGGTAAGDWQTLGADTSPGYRAWDIVLPVPLDPGADLYLRWADDNALTAGGEAAAENAWSLDDVRVVMSVSADPSVRGDADCDGDVDEADYLALKAHLGHTDATWQEGDFNHDGIAGSEDLSLLEHNFDGLGLSSPPAPTPEPASLAMLAAGALGILLRRRPGR